MIATSPKTQKKPAAWLEVYPANGGPFLKSIRKTAIFGGFEQNEERLSQYLLYQNNRP